MYENVRSGPLFELLKWRYQSGNGEIGVQNDGDGRTNGRRTHTHDFLNVSTQKPLRGNYETLFRTKRSRCSTSCSCSAVLNTISDFLVSGHGFSVCANLRSVISSTACKSSISGLSQADRAVQDAIDGAIEKLEHDQHSIPVNLLSK